MKESKEFNETALVPKGFEEIDFPITNKLVFALVMQHPEICRKLIDRIIPDRKVKEVRLHDKPITVDSMTEVSIITGIANHGIRLDVLFEEDDTWFDIEMQTGAYDHIPKRTRYYHSLMDQAYLKTGMAYEKLAPQYVIFICTFDPVSWENPSDPDSTYNPGLPIYRFRMLEDKNHLPLGDLSYTILVNTKAKQDDMPDELRSFCNYVNKLGLDETDEMVSEIHDQVVVLNRNEKARGVFMTLDEWIKEEAYYRSIELSKEAREKALIEGRAEGLAEGRAEGLAEGRAEGLAEGRAEGELIGSLQTLCGFVKDGIISYEDAVLKAPDPVAFEKMYKEIK